MSPTPLFRTSALNAAKVKSLGEIVLIRPVSFSILTLLVASMAILLICFMILGSYTKRSTVSGQLVPDVGVLKVYVPQPGVILEKHVREGQRVKKGELLYLTSSERQSGKQDGIQAAISRQVERRVDSLRNELSEQRKLQQDEEDALRKKIHGLHAEQSNVVHQLFGQRARVELAEAAFVRSEKLRLQGYISTEMSQQKQADLLDQKNRLQTLERDQINIERELQAQQDELRSLPLRQRSQAAQTERLIASTAQEWTESEGKRQITVTAAESGVATGVTAEVGQSVDGNTPMVSIIPDGAMLQANLFAPSRAIGFIHRGDRVLLRFQAYPYQKFGHAVGVVASVSRVALALNELVGYQATANANGEPLYRITVLLGRQSVTAYGKPELLQAGMLVEADILHETRKLYEWVLEPLYSLTGKL
jgi:membrane fusion protein